MQHVTIVNRVELHPYLGLIKVNPFLKFFVWFEVNDWKFKFICCFVCQYPWQSASFFTLQLFVERTLGSLSNTNSLSTSPPFLRSLTRPFVTTAHFWKAMAQAASKWQFAMENTVKCYIAIVIIVSGTIGSIMLHYGRSCKDTKQREENKNSTCKDIHNDGSAAALTWIGFILWAPLQIIFIILVLYFCRSCLRIILGDGSIVEPASD